jgi:hypothetical protein
MGNKHTKQEYNEKLNKLGELLWKLATDEYLEKEEEIIDTLKYAIQDEELDFVFNCKYFNPLHYIIVSSLWLSHETFLKLSKLTELVYTKCGHARTHWDTKLLVFQNQNHVSNVNLNYIRMEKVKASLMRTGTMDNLSVIKYDINKLSLTQERKNDEDKISSFTAYGKQEDKTLKPPPPIKKRSNSESCPPKKEIDRSVTYYILDDNEKKSYDENISKIKKPEARVSSKKLWFHYAIYNKNMWESSPNMKGLLEEIAIGEMSYLAIISFIQIKVSGKFSSTQDAQKNLVHLYKVIMGIEMKPQKRKKSISEKFKSFFDK